MMFAIVPHIIFYIFATLAVVSALVVITARNPVKSVLALVVTFFSMSGVWMLLSAEFLSLILLLVYVGAVMTLFLFVVMMLNIDLVSQRPQSFTRYLPLGIIVVVVMVGIMMVGFGSRFGGMPIPVSPSENYSNVTQLGYLLYTEYAYPFEIAGVLLLAAIIAAISLAHRQSKSRKSQKIADQINVRREDRVRLIPMPSEKKK